MTAFFLQYRSERRTRAVLAAGLAILLTNAVLWLAHSWDGDLDVRLGGVVLFPLVLTALPAVLLLFRWGRMDLDILKPIVGSGGAWMRAVGLPILAYGAVAMLLLPGEGVDPGWKWITLAASAAFDLPVLILWMAPGVILLGLVLWHPWPGTGGRVLSLFLWLAPWGVEIGLGLGAGKTEQVAELVAILVGTGLLGWTLDQRGALLPAVGAVTTILLLHLLLFGTESSLLARALLGADVTELRGLLPRTEAPLWARVLPALAAGLLGSLGRGSHPSPAATEVQGPTA